MLLAQPSHTGARLFFPIYFVCIGCFVFSGWHGDPTTLGEWAEPRPPHHHRRFLSRHQDGQGPRVGEKCSDHRPSSIGCSRCLHWQCHPCQQLPENTRHQLRMLRPPTPLSSIYNMWTKYETSTSTATATAATRRPNEKKKLLSPPAGRSVSMTDYRVSPQLPRIMALSRQS